MWGLMCRYECQQFGIPRRDSGAHIFEIVTEINTKKRVGNSPMNHPTKLMQKYTQIQPNIHFLYRRESTMEGLQRDDGWSSRSGIWLSNRLLPHRGCAKFSSGLINSLTGDFGLADMVSYASTKAFTCCRGFPLESAERSGGKNDAFRKRQKGFPFSFSLPLLEVDRRKEPTLVRSLYHLLIPRVCCPLCLRWCYSM